MDEDSHKQSIILRWGVGETPGRRLALLCPCPPTATQQHHSGHSTCGQWSGGVRKWRREMAEENRAGAQTAISTGINHVKTKGTRSDYWLRPPSNSGKGLVINHGSCNSSMPLQESMEFFFHSKLLSYLPSCKLESSWARLPGEEHSSSPICARFALLAVYITKLYYYTLGIWFLCSFWL